MNVDIGGVLSLLNPEYSAGKFCAICNLNHMRDNNLICKKCPMILNSPPSGGTPSRIALGRRFKEYGLTSKYPLAKYQFFFLLSRPKLKFEFPLPPTNDLLGNWSNILFPMIKGIENSKSLRREIHHINRFSWDDRTWNLAYVVNTEHRFIHGGSDLMKSWKIIQARSKEWF